MGMQLKYTKCREDVSEGCCKDAVIKMEVRKNVQIIEIVVEWHGNIKTNRNEGYF